MLRAHFQARNYQCPYMKRNWVMLSKFSREWLVCICNLKLYWFQLPRGSHLAHTVAVLRQKRKHKNEPPSWEPPRKCQALSREFYVLLIRIFVLCHSSADTLFCLSRVSSLIQFCNMINALTLRHHIKPTFIILFRKPFWTVYHSPVSCINQLRTPVVHATVLGLGKFLCVFV
jgi:hypothetical protein